MLPDSVYDKDMHYEWETNLEGVRQFGGAVGGIGGGANAPAVAIAGAVFLSNPSPTRLERNCQSTQPR